MSINFLGSTYGYYDGNQSYYQPGTDTRIGYNKGGWLHSIATNGKADTFEFSSKVVTKEPTLVWGGADDTIKLTGSGWAESNETKGKDLIKDNITGFYGRIWADNNGHRLFIAGDAKVILNGSRVLTALSDKVIPRKFASITQRDLPPAKQSPEAIGAGISKIEEYNTRHGGGKDQFVTKNEIQKALDDHVFDTDPVGKKYWQGVVNAMNMNLLTPEKLGGNGSDKDLLGIRVSTLTVAQDKGFNFLI